MAALVSTQSREVLALCFSPSGGWRRWRCHRAVHTHSIQGTVLRLLYWVQPTWLSLTPGEWLGLWPCGLSATLGTDLSPLCTAEGAGLCTPWPTPLSNNQAWPLGFYDGMGWGTVGYHAGVCCLVGKLCSIVSYFSETFPLLGQQRK